MLIMGCLMVVTGIMLLMLRATMKRNGHMLDGAKRTSSKSWMQRAGSAQCSPSPSQLSDSNDLCVVVDKGAGSAGGNKQPQHHPAAKQQRNSGHSC